jgi:processive 1,2-diacylglycerol beta-glucosyltransferase
MEALIMSCKTGGGHNAAGQAVMEELQRRGHRATFLDPYQLAGEKTADMVGNAYVKLVQKSPKAFGSVYALGEAYRNLRIHSPVYAANRRMADYMQQYLKEHRYDVILMPHIFPAHILTSLREKQIEIPPTVLIATDYACIPFMEEAICDYYVIPSEDLKEEFCGHEIPRERMLPFGIPVRRAFADTSAEEARARLHFNPLRKYILLSGGSIGAGKIEETVWSLVKYMENKPEYTLVIVCGNNQKLYHLLQKEHGKHAQIQLLQSTLLMAEYVKACDVFITKPGGLSSTEAAAAGVPLIHISPIPGCETRNVDFFEERGMSIYARNTQIDLFAALERLEDESVRRRMIQAQHRYINSKAVMDICDFLEAGIKKENRIR